VLIIIGDFKIEMCIKNQKAKLLQQNMQSLEMQEITHKLLQKGNMLLSTFGQAYEFNIVKSIYQKHIGLTMT